MNVKYLGSYVGNVGNETDWQPGEVREIQDEEFAATLAASPLWEETDEPVGLEFAEPDPPAKGKTPAKESGDNASAETATPQAATVPKDGKGASTGEGQ